MRVLAMVAASVLLIGASPRIPTPPPLLPLVNADRAQAGDPAVVEDPALDEIAFDRAADMVAQHWYSHCLPRDQSCSAGADFVWRLATYPVAANGAAENIALIPGDDAAAANTAWLHSAEHHASIVRPIYRRFGSARLCCYTPGTWVWVEIFVG